MNKMTAYPKIKCYPITKFLLFILHNVSWFNYEFDKVIFSIHNWEHTYHTEDTIGSGVWLQFLSLQQKDTNNHNLCYNLKHPQKRFMFATIFWLMKKNQNQNRNRNRNRNQNQNRKQITVYVNDISRWTLFL